MAESEDIAPKRRQIRVVLAGTGLVLLIQFWLTQQLMPPTSDYALYWRPFQDLVVLLNAMLPLVSMVTIIVGFILSRKSADVNGTVLSVGLAALWLILLLPSCRASVGMALGGGRGQTLATAEVAGHTYRLDFITAGDPPINYFGLYECEFFGWSCKELGTIYPDKYIQNAPEVALISKGEQLEVSIAGIVVGNYISGQLVCASIDQFSCQPR